MHNNLLAKLPENLTQLTELTVLNLVSPPRQIAVAPRAHGARSSPTTSLTTAL